MILLRFPHHSDPAATFWVSVFAVIGLVGIYVITKLTKGFIFRYHDAKINKYLLAFLSSVHIFGSLIVALILPNNYLYRFKTFELMYKYNPAWIGGSIIIVFFLLLIVIGIVLTLIFKNRIPK